MQQEFGKIMLYFWDVVFSQGAVGIIAAVLGIIGLVVVVVWSFLALHSGTGTGTGTVEKLPRSKGQSGNYRQRLVAYLHHAEDLYREGYHSFKGQIYRMTTTDGTYVEGICHNRRSVGTGWLTCGRRTCHGSHAVP